MLGLEPLIEYNPAICPSGTRGTMIEMLDMVLAARFKGIASKIHDMILKPLLVLAVCNY